MNTKGANDILIFCHACNDETGGHGDETKHWRRTMTLRSCGFGFVSRPNDSMAPHCIRHAETDCRFSRMVFLASRGKGAEV